MAKMAKTSSKTRLSSQVLMLAVLFLILFPAILPLFKPYVSGTADGLGHRFRLVSFYNALKKGILRPRWAKEVALGYGAPIFLFNYPLPYYLASILLYFGFSVNLAGQLFSAFCLFSSAVFMYLAGKRLGGNLGGLLAALVYCFAPYHLQMTYLYDSWGEMAAFIFPPLILYLVLKITDCFDYGSRADILYFTLLTLVWALLILSHNVSAIMFSPVLLMLAFFVSRFRFRVFLSIVNRFILAVVVSSFFWLPAWMMKAEMKYPFFLTTEGAMRGSFFKSFSFQLDTAIRVIGKGTTHYLDFTVGLPILTVGIIGLFYLFNFCLFHFLCLLKRKRHKEKALQWIKACFSTPPLPLTIILFLLLAISLYFTNYASNWLWNFPPFNLILYPFRFLFLASFAGALLTAVIVKPMSFIKPISPTTLPNYHATVHGSRAGKEKSWLLALIFIVLTIVQGRPYINPYIEIFPFENNYFFQRQTVTSAPFTRKNMLIKEFLPVGASFQFLKQEERRYLEASFEGKAVQKSEVSISEGAGAVKRVEAGVERIFTAVEVKKTSTILFNRFFFPNWEVFLDGKKHLLTIDREGRMKTQIPSGEHQLQLVFGQSKVEKIANTVSLLGIVIMLIELLTKSLLQSQSLLKWLKSKIPRVQRDNHP